MASAASGTTVLATDANGSSGEVERLAVRIEDSEQPLRLSRRSWISGAVYESAQAQSISNDRRGITLTDHQTSASTPDPNQRPHIALTGATGYIGGRLLGRLEEAGYRVRCLTRRPAELRPRLGPLSTAVEADMLKPENLRVALQGTDVAFYLVHSMGSAEGFEEKDRVAAEHFGNAARDAGVKRIIYLGGLGTTDGEMSAHLRSRQEVGEVLRSSGVEVIEFRASIVIGAGSLSFEMVRSLVERLPVMVTPRWVAVTAQPIAIDDLLEYLLAAVTHPEQGTRIYEIGGAEQVSYGEIMREYARQRGLRRWMLPVPVLSPRVSSLWLGLVTPLYARVGRKLIDSIRHPTVVHDQSALAAFPVVPVGLSEAIAAAIRSEEEAIAATRWSDALSA
ncbi:MAG: NAD(P)H-binding protein, partial [Thermomicrobiales bacterium]